MGKARSRLVNLLVPTQCYATDEYEYIHWSSPGVANVAYERAVRLDLDFDDYELKDLL